MPANSLFVKYEMLRFRHGPLVFLLYNFISKIHTNIDTELCTCLNFFDLWTWQGTLSSFRKLDQTTFKRLKYIILKCVLSTSAGNLLTFFFPVCNNPPVRVISRVGKWPEITVVCCLRGQTHQTCSYFNIAWLLTLRILPFWSYCQTQSQMD